MSKLEQEVRKNMPILENKTQKSKSEMSIYERRMAMITDQYTDTWTEDNKPLLEKVGPDLDAKDNIQFKK